MQEHVDIPNQEDVQALEELKREAIANGNFEEQAEAFAHQAESIGVRTQTETEPNITAEGVDDEDVQLLDNAYAKIGAELQERTDEMVKSGMSVS